MKQILKTTSILFLAVFLIAGVGWYTFHIWDDCLEENNFLTCMRMLSK